MSRASLVLSAEGLSSKRPPAAVCMADAEEALRAENEQLKAELERMGARLSEIENPEGGEVTLHSLAAKLAGLSEKMDRQAEQVRPSHRPVVLPRQISGQPPRQTAAILPQTNRCHPHRQFSATLP